MTDFDKFGRRGRPQRDIYTPGRGPLRRSGKDELQNGSGSLLNPDRALEINKITETLKKISFENDVRKEPDDSKAADSSKKTRKPDCEIYVPKRVAEAHALRQKELMTTEKKPPDIPNLMSLPTSEKKSSEKPKRSKKKKNKGSDECSGDTIKQMPLYFRAEDYKRKSLAEDRNPANFVRFGSEPRSLPVTQQDNRLRDPTRSTDPSWMQEKTSSKPPLGRRGSLSKGGGKSPFDNLPPRLLKKRAESMNLQLEQAAMPPPETSAWDGHTMMFHSKPGAVPDRRPMEPTNILKPSNPPEWSRTLPGPGRARGRGRLNSGINHSVQPVRMTRSLTPESVTRGQFEDVTEDKPKSQLPTSLPETISDAQDNSSSMESSITINEDNGPVKRTNRSDTENVLDWAAEVERCELASPEPYSEPFLFSDQFVQPPPPRPAGAKEEKKKKRNKGKRKHSKDRSLSRDVDLGPRSRDLDLGRRSRDRASRERGSFFRRGSVDNNSNGSRNASADRNWRERSHDQRSRNSSFCDNRSRTSSIDRQDGFVNRYSRSRQNSSCDNRSRQSSLERRESHFGPSRRSRKGGEGRRRGEDRERERRHVEELNWHLEAELHNQREREGRASLSHGGKAAGILVLPEPIKEETPSRVGQPPPTRVSQTTSPPTAGKKLFDPNNPVRFIPVTGPPRGGHLEEELKPFCPSDVLVSANAPEQITAKPIWYNPYTQNFQISHNPEVIRAVEQADCELQYLLSTCELLKYWERMQLLRSFLKDSFKRLLLTDLRFCEMENVEQHFWKILFYSIIEMLRKLMVDQPDSKESFRQALLSVIGEGTEYYEELLRELEAAHNIKLDVFLSTPMCMRDSLKFNPLALIAAQKLYLSLGDLARYREQANETSNYGLARQWYMKAHQINPKNGRPYNQLAILALYTKRKLDAVYYYMRSLMSSNPISSARESLITLFDESRKKYEAVDRKRKEEKSKKDREKMKEKESGGGIRREIWIHPGGRKNMHRTTSTCNNDLDSEDEELYSASEIEVNKRFVTSYLHVHGKIFSKIGLETLTETALQMLKQFRALLQHSPLPLNSNRFLQLFALNMFAIENSQPKGDMVVKSEEGCYRSATQESALVISLQMFNLLVERFIAVLQENTNGHSHSNGLLVPPDCLEMLPALKVWCDWLMTHVDIWNPPPSCQDYRVGPAGDCWSRTATLINLLEKLDHKMGILSSEKLPDYELVYLPEDATLAGFTPLMANINEPKYKHKDIDLELAQVILRIQKILFLGTVFLCGLDPPALKLQKLTKGDSEYISVVDTETNTDQSFENQSSFFKSRNHKDLLAGEEEWSESEDSGKDTGPEEEEEPDPSVGGLIARRKELKQIHQQARRRSSQIARLLNVFTEMEIKPHHLVPDTNCFIECLAELEKILQVLPHPQHPYVFMVPLVVVNEVEGLSKGCKPSQSIHHSALVREMAKAAMALFQKKHPALRTCTTRGTPLSSAVFTLEEDSGPEMTNDDKILMTCMNLCRTLNKDEVKEGGKRKLYRDVVLLTEDRNLSLKAMGRDMPVRSLPDFMKWAGLG